MRRSILLPAVLLLLARPARALETASFLNVGVGARGLGMGGAYTALADDANAIYWNPAALTSVENGQFQASDAELTQSRREGFMAVARTAPAGTFAGAVTYLDHGSLDGRDAQGRPTSGFNASDTAVAAAYARRAGPLDLGGSVKFVQSHIGSTQGTTFGADFGARKRLGPVVLAATLRNAGPGMKFDAETDDLPLRVALGAAYLFPGGHALSAEVTDSPRGAGNEFAVGGELRALKDVYLRAGYTTQSAITGGTGFDAISGLTLGVGLRRARWTLDYATAPMGELGTAHRFTIGVRF